MKEQKIGTEGIENVNEALERDHAQGQSYGRENSTPQNKELANAVATGAATRSSAGDSSSFKASPRSTENSKKILENDPWGGGVRGCSNYT